MAFASDNIEDMPSEFELDNADTEKYELVESIVKTGTEEQIKQVIESCAGDNNVRNKALLLAAQKGWSELVRYLVSKGADVNVKGEVDGNRTPDNALGIPWLFTGPDRNVTPLMLAAEKSSTECMGILIEAGADVNAVDSRGRTGLRRIITRADLEVVNRLLHAGADVNVVDHEEHTALFKAVDEILPDCVSALIQAGADVNLMTSHGTALLWATRKPEHNIRFLYSEEVEVQSRLEIVSLLLSAGADVNVVNARGETPLYCAGAGNLPEAVPLLVDAGADVNISNFFGDTILGVVAATSVHRNIKLVLKAGAHVNIGDSLNQNALELFLSCRVIDKKIAMLLFAAGETVKSRTASTPSSGHPYQVPVYLLQKEQSLMSICREAIRKHLLDVSPVNLFCRVPQLRLPSLLVEYLLYYMTIEPEDDDSVTMHQSEDELNSFSRIISHLRFLDNQL